MVADNVVARTISHALTRGAEPMATFATPEAPGHHACMLYAAIACPYLSRSTARRTIAGHGSTAQESVTAGTRRGMFSGLVCFAEAVVENPADTYGYTIVYKRPLGIRTYHNGIELRADLRDVIAREPGPGPGQRLFARDVRAIERELRQALAEHENETRSPYHR
ncbi:hypothetical protein [Amycolatopsis sp. CA-230715]|uniref:hypothetical protein n=1 Tax=Amycolatopsis sp. CA-230715 TaxID=2745196 RepID=UPI001C013B1E|nr:hypothetical protein [Amycolatopsis sp. CA-230715]QWF85792.1 hypothetical protein HUW46_09272 [Amycolatopsis sp. CA-230715]